MARIVENIISQPDNGYEHYGCVTVSVRDTETGSVATSTVEYTPSKSEGEATSEAIKEASNSF